MTQRKTTDPTVNQYGAEEHPAFGKISASRISSTPGAVLFQSDVLHGEFIRITVTPATRQRTNNHDYVGDTGKALMEVDLSLAQFASFVSSMNTSGVPCTIRRTENDWQVPNLPYDPRLAHSMAEVQDAAARTFGEIVEAMEAVDALDAKTPARERKEALATLRAKIKNAQPNVKFAASSLNKYSEDVVQKARADIEAMVQGYATQLQLTAAQTREVLALPAMPGEAADA